MFDLLKTISQLDKEKVVCENKCIHEYDNENGMEWKKTSNVFLLKIFKVTYFIF